MGMSTNVPTDENVQLNDGPPLSPRTWSSWLGVAALTCMWLMPVRLQRALASLLARTYLRFAGGKSRHLRIVDINLSACLPDLDAAARRALKHEYLTTLVMVAFNTARLWWASARIIRSHTRFFGLEHLQEARRQQRRVVLLISHTVALDSGMIALSPDYAMTGFYKPFPNPVLDWLVRRSRRRFGGKPVARGEGFRDIIKRVKAGEVLCYLSDEDLGPKGSVFADFFNHRKATLSMLPRIVRHTDAVVIPMATYMDVASASFDVHLQPPLENYPAGDEIVDATRLNEAIEASVLFAPAQYLWKLRLYRTCPDGGKESRYARIERGELEPGDL